MGDNLLSDKRADISDDEPATMQASDHQRPSGALEAENPLLSTALPIPFGEIGPGQIVPGLRQALSEAEQRLGSLIAAGQDEESLTFTTTIGALDEVAELLERPYRLAHHLHSVANSPELRAAFNEVQPEVVAFFARLASDQSLWRVLKRFAASPAAKRLNDLQRRHLEKTLEEFRRAGADLPDDERQRVEELKVKLARLGTSFSENVLDATNAYELSLPDEERLSGLPQGALRAARAAASQAGQDGYRFTLQAPSYLPVMMYADDRELRRELHDAFFAVGMAEPYDNRQLVREILQTRQELARLLGYRDYADLQTEDRMAGSGERAWQFVTELTAKTRPYFLTEARELTAYAADLGIDELQPWDVAYVTEKLRLKRFAVDEEALRPYFPLPQVLSGLFELTEKLFGVKVERTDHLPTWHEEVEQFQLKHEDGTELGVFYADWFPRDSKRGGAWMSGLVTGGTGPEGFEPHVGVIAANLTAPEGDQPALLSHSEVETVFHEFGHLLHHLLSRVEIRRRSSMNVPWDFVELPSQIMENWTWQEQALALFARHYQSGEPLPSELFERMQRSRSFMGATKQMRQLSFGTADLTLHREFDPTGKDDPLEVARQAVESLEIRPTFASGNRMARFTHIFAGGYAAGYYSYKWSEMLDADAFSRFEEEGIFNPTTGRDFANKILAKGDSVDVAELFRDFMGRDPSVEALIRRNLGI